MSCPSTTVGSNTIATNAITGKLNEVSKIAEALDIALRDTQNCLEMDECGRSLLDRKAEGNTSIDSRGSLDVNKKKFYTVKTILCQIENSGLKSIYSFLFFLIFAGTKFNNEIID